MSFLVACQSIPFFHCKLTRPIEWSLKCSLRILGILFSLYCNSMVKKIILQHQTVDNLPVVSVGRCELVRMRGRLLSSSKWVSRSGSGGASSGWYMALMQFEMRLLISQDPAMEFSARRLKLIRDGSSQLHEPETAPWAKQAETAILFLRICAWIGFEVVIFQLPTHFFSIFSAVLQVPCRICSRLTST